MSDTSLVFNILAKDKASKTFDKLKGSALVAGAAIGAALSAGLASTLDSSKANAMLAAQLGAGPKMAKEFGEISGRVYARGIAGSLDEANAALKGVWQNGLVAEDAATADIERVSARVVNLGALMTEDADRVSSAVSQMLRTGLASSAEQAFDVLTRGVQQGVNKSQDLLDTFNEYGTQFRKLGLDGPAAMGLLSQAIRAGARDSDTAADALKEFAIRAVDGSKTSAAGFKALGLDAGKMSAQIARGGSGASAGLATVLQKLREIKDPVKQGQAAVALFGTKAEDLGNALYAMDPSKAADALGNVAGAADRAGKTLEESAGAKLEHFKRQAQSALVQTLAQAIPYIQGTFGWLERNSSWVGPLSTALGIFATVIGGIIIATKIWTAVQTAFNVVMALNPVGLLVIAILAVIAVIVLIATKTTWFQTLWKTVWGGIKTAAAAVGSWFRDTLWRQWILGAWNGIIGAGMRVHNWFRALPGRLLRALVNVATIISRPFRSAFNLVSRLWNNTVGRLHFSIPSWVPGVGGKGFAMPQLPMLARGGTVNRSGMAIVGEAGPELVTLARGAQVTPLRGAAAGGGRGGGAARLELAGEREIVAFLRRLIKRYDLL